jgi:catechol 2,3-dioxygenase-like lactoylglutathione lyase family enzyme
MPKLDGILETAIHTEDMVRARTFYEGVLGLEPIYSDNRLSAYAVAGRDVLLVFRKGTTGQTVVLPSGTIPGHGGDVWRSPLARTNSIVGRHISLRAESLSKGATIGNAVDAASISAIRTVTFWNWQRRD